MRFSWKWANDRYLRFSRSVFNGRFENLAYPSLIAYIRFVKAVTFRKLKITYFGLRIHSYYLNYVGNRVESKS